MKILSPTMLYVIFVGTLGLIFVYAGFIGCAGLGALPLVAIIEAVSMSMILTSGFLYIFLGFIIHYFFQLIFSQRDSVIYVKRVVEVLKCFVSLAIQCEM